MVNREALINDLTLHGTVVFCDANNVKSYVVVVSDVTADIATMKQICDTHLLTDYPYENTMTLVDGLFKTEYDITL